MSVVGVSMFFIIFLGVFFVVLVRMPWMIVIIINGSWAGMAVALYINHRWRRIMAMRSFYNNTG